VYEALNFRLESKLKNDGFSGIADAADVDGTWFTFKTQFVDVTSIVITPKFGSTAAYAMYDFVDEPYPTGFYVYLYDKSGHRVTGEVSIAIRGY
jgi:hypothetical protein